MIIIRFSPMPVVRVNCRASQLAAPPSLTLQAMMLVVGLALTVGSMAYSQETRPPVLSPRQTWSTCFGGKEVTLHYLVSAPVDTPWLEWRLGWSLSAEGRTLVRGETALKKGQDASAVAAIQTELPEVRPGISVELRLNVELLDRRRKKLATHGRLLWLFSENPFADRSRWLTQLEIGLFDPPGRTAATLQAMGVPFESIHDLAAVKTHEAKLLVIGEGVSFVKNSSLGEILIRRAMAGGKALCLAPAEGLLTLPDPTSGINKPQRIVLRRMDVITALDKRLDALAWQSGGPIIASSLVVAAEQDRMAFHVAHDDSGWPWVELHYPSRGSTHVCGFAIIERWDSGPTPRHLFARMLEHIADGE